ncbi:type II secretion system secretin GspD [Phenylobacterium sp.]|uniref:type II secretion system secretin GspD n=1 Tax=Phenylobacterium sp. TaxID=1871053 RepID=UPI00121EA1B7|nr:type II secretion system secretin GspD [Phenylobacterium sp.]THD60626.1 MAG: type II secretion system protein GspD [Phenylobacterium sp.]
MRARELSAAACAAALILGGCVQDGHRPPAPPRADSPVIESPPPAAPADLAVRTTIVPGISQAVPPAGPPVTRLRSGDVSLNFPGADVQVVAKAVLGDLLGLSFTVPPQIHTPVTVVTQRPIARADVFRVFEAALTTADLAVERREGVYAILPIEQARDQAPLVNGPAEGFATEVIHLNFVSAEELRRLLDPILPNVITQADVAHNTISVSGTSGQRASIHELVRQFDVDWLRNTSFALFVPQRTDSRLIVPELDKLINANGAPTKGLVRLIAMDRLNGILAVSTQPRYLDDVRRWVEILDREGQSSERRVYVYRVQNGRSADLARVLANAFGGSSSSGSSDNGRNSRLSAQEGPVRDDLGSPQAPQSVSGAPQAPPNPFGAPVTPGASSAGVTMNAAANPNNLPVSGPTSVDIQADGLHAKVSSDETNNAIVVYATPRDYAVIEDALRKLDVAPNQVMIEAAIVEVTLNDQLQYGVQWQFSGGSATTALAAAPTTGLSIAPTAFSQGLNYFYSHRSIAASLTALETLTKINVVSSPKLLVLNNQTASLQVGDQVPTLSATSTSTIGSNAPVVNSIDYRDTGIILKITPRVNSSGVVLLDLSQEVSAVVPSTDPLIDSPTISTRKIATSVSVQDGEVIALGGLISNSIQDTQTGIPYLSRIPILKNLFGTTNNQHMKTELIVLLQPRVVRTVDDGRALTDELREKLKTLRPLLPTSSVP